MSALLEFIQTSLADYITLGIFAFLLTFVRIGTSIMLIPGVGDSFVSNNIRLVFAIAMSFILTPLTAEYMPSQTPTGFGLFFLIGTEFLIGLLYGTIARIFMTALDTAGMVISMQSGIGNAQLFNPALASQGSLMGAFLSVAGVVFLFAMNLHVILIMGLMETYQIFPVGGIPNSASMADLVAQAVMNSFRIGIQIAAPFMVMTLLIYLGMGVLSRLMPQIQVFILALPLQILLSLVLMTITISTIMLFWASAFQDAIVYFLTL